MMYPPEVIDPLVAQTDELCAHQQVAARTRMLLLRLEKQAHKAGWDTQPPALFHVQHNPDTGRTKHHWGVALNHLFRMIADENGGKPGRAIVSIAELAERSFAGEFDDTMPPHMLAQLNQFRRPGQDVLAGNAPGWAFYGYGFITEAWGASVPKSEHDEYRHGQLKHRPDRIEMRQIVFTSRDGLFWTVARERGHSPIAFVLRPESTLLRMVGDVGHGLSRLTNVMASNPVPIRERTYEG